MTRSILQFGQPNVMFYGAKADGKTDDAAALQAAIYAAGLQGAVVFPPGNYFISTALRLPYGANQLILSGYGAFFKLGVGCAHLFDCYKEHDGDTFQNIVIEGFRVDCKAVTAPAFSVIGATYGAHINWEHVSIRDITAFDIPTDPTGAIYPRGVYILSAHDSDQEATQNYIRDVLIERCRFDGGNEGINITGWNATSAATLTNILIDHITLRDCYHDTGITPAGFWAASNFIVGNKGRGGRCLISNCAGYNSGDVGVEVNGLSDVTLENCYIENAVNSYYQTNYSVPLDGANQRVTWRDCAAVNRGGYVKSSWQIDAKNRAGAYGMSGCKWLSEQTPIDSPNTPYVHGDPVTVIERDNSWN